MKLRAVIDLRLSLALKFITRCKRCSIRSRSFRVLFLTLLSPALLPVLQAQDNFEIQIYPSETVAAGENMLELHSNYTIEGQRAQVNGVLPSHHALHETIEYTHGFNLWFETGFYLFTSPVNTT